MAEAVATGTSGKVVIRGIDKQMVGEEELPVIPF